MWAPEIKTKKRLRYFNCDRAYRTRHRFMVKHHRSYSQIRRLRTTKNLIEIPLLSAVCWLEQTQSFYSQVHIINGFVGGEDGGSEGGGAAPGPPPRPPQMVLASGPRHSWRDHVSPAAATP